MPKEKAIDRTRLRLQQECRRNPDGTVSAKKNDHESEIRREGGGDLDERYGSEVNEEVM
jgi:hypothetical protein